jgi:hypothetical protein
LCGVVLQKTKAVQRLCSFVQMPKISPKTDVLVSCELHPPRKKIVEEKPPKAVVGVVVIHYLSAFFTAKRAKTADDA